MLRRFSKDQRGSIAVMFAGLLPVILGGAFLGVEALRLVRAKSQLQQALDAAALAAGQARYEGASAQNIQAVVDRLVAANLSGTGLTPSVSINTSAAANKVTLDATLSFPLLTNVFGQNGFSVAAHSAAEASNQRTEVVLVLDTTLSMGINNNEKLNQLKSSAKSFATKLMLQPDGRSSRPNVAVAVVPFNDYVWLSKRDYGNQTLDWLTDTTDRTETVQQWAPPTTDWTCQGGYVVTDPQGCSTRAVQTMVDGSLALVNRLVCDVPGFRTCPGGMASTPVPGYYRNVTNHFIWYGAVGSRKAPWDETVDNLNSGNKHYAYFNVASGVANRPDGEAPGTLQRLTTDKTKIDYVLDRLVPHRETYTAPGLLWGWHALDPGAPFRDGVAYGAAQKVIVLMTDGVNTKSARQNGTTDYFIHTGSDTSAANAKTASVCANIKARGIRIYTIAYMFENGDTTLAAKTMLQNCASDSARFYDAASTALLEQTFSNIVAELIPVRLAE